MPQVLGAALRFALLLATVYAYPGWYSDSQLRACAAGSCPSAHRQAPSAGSALSVAGKTDGGSYIPGETIQVSNAGGGQYALYAEAGGTKLSREDDGPMTLTAPASGDLVIVGIRAAGQSACTYQKLTLTPSASSPSPPSPSSISPPPPPSPLPPPPGSSTILDQVGEAGNALSSGADNDRLGEAERAHGILIGSIGVVFIFALLLPCLCYRPCKRGGLGPCLGRS